MDKTESRCAADMEVRALSRETVLEHLVNFAWDVFDTSQNERLRARAGSIIDAYVPDRVSFAESERIHELVRSR